MKLFKIIRFYLAITLAFPFVGLYLVGAAATSGQWSLLKVKLQLIHLALYQKFVEEKQEAVSKAMLRQRIKNLTSTKS